MENSKKNYSTIISYLFLVIGYGSMLWYFNDKTNELKDRELELTQKEIKLKSANKTETVLMNKICDSVNKKQITEEINTLKSESNVEISKVTHTKSPIYIQIGSESTKANLSRIDFVSKLKNLNHNVIDEYDLELNRADNTVRYFNKEDEQIAKKLCEDISKQFSISLEIKYVKLPNITVPNGQLEIWVK